MNILIINTLYTPNHVGGAEKSVQLLAEKLNKLNHEVSVVSLDKKRDIKRINGVKVYYLKNKNIFWPFDQKKKNIVQKLIWHLLDTFVFLYSKEILKIIEETNPNIIHTNNLSGFSTNILKFIKRKKGIPIVHTSRDYHLLCISNTLFKKDRTCQKLCVNCKIFSYQKIKNINKNVNTFVGISDFILIKHVEHGLNPTIKKEVVYNAVDEQLSRKSKNINLVTTFGFVGGLNTAKGVDRLLIDFNSKELKNKDWKLKIAGKGDSAYMDSLKWKYKNNKIEFVGFVKSSDFYDTLDALIVPSQWEEPFGRVVIEAVQKGLPVFVSDKGGLKELRDEIKSVSSYNIDNILNFLNRKEPSEIKESLNNFKSEKITNQYISLYQNLISKENKI